MSNGPRASGFASTQRLAAFRSTRWSVLLDVGAGDPDRAQRALAEICRSYWYPLYAYLRRAGESESDAADLVQGLFADLVQRGDIGRIERSGGRFRSWLLAALRHHQSHVRERARTAKRGGDRVHVPLGESATFAPHDAESRYSDEPTGGETPEQLYERRFAVTLITEAFEQFRFEESERGNAAEFESLSPWLHGERPDGGYARLSEATGRSEGALKVAVHRLRSRWRQCLLAVVAGLVDRPQDVEDEVRALFSALESPDSR